MRRADADPINGVLALDKPAAISSNAALQRARRLLGARKGGHTGTLDPLATGLLPLTFGEATKFSADLLDADKVYEAELVLGISTASGDEEGEILSRREVCVTDDQVRTVLQSFVGEQRQVPPMFSALKHNGRPLYELARQGIEIEREARQIVIRSVDCLAFAGDRLSIRVACSKGTYIRVLAHDIGEHLGCGAHLRLLRRTGVGPLMLSQAFNLDQLESMTLEARRAALFPVDYLLQALPRLELAPDLGRRFVQGQRLILPPAVVALSPSDTSGNGRRVRVYDHDGELLGVARHTQHRLEPERLLASV
jgi:tRNA pseudouridine55 synthase